VGFKTYKYINHKISLKAFEQLFLHFLKNGMRDIRQPSDTTRRPKNGIIGIEVLLDSCGKIVEYFYFHFRLTPILSHERGVSHFSPRYRCQAEVELRRRRPKEVRSPT
jgi:hypothetical protein